MSDNLPRDADETGVVVDERAGRAEGRSCGRAHELDADLLEEIERGLVDPGELILVEEVDVAECVSGRRPGEDGRCRARGPAVRPLAARAAASL